ncbi:MAG: hypothetical protein OEY23_17990 [Acidimicrobiia bacterium]|nr:hypothetical protein [Acidimicrobiia bacterium]
MSGDEHRVSGDEHRVRADALVARLLDGVPLALGQARLVTIGGVPVTVARGRSDAVEIAERRGTPLIDVRSGPLDGLATRPPRGSGTVVVGVGGHPVAWAGDDFSIGFGPGVADVADADPDLAADIVRDLLQLVPDVAEASAPRRIGGLTGVVPYELDGAYEIDDVLDAVLDGAAPRVELGGASGASEVVTLLGRLVGVGVGVVASRAAFGRGALGPRAWRRIARLVALCDRLRRPVLFLVDTAGLAPGAPAGQLEATALREALATVVTATPAKFAVVLGRAYGLGATLCGAVGARADAVAAWPRAEIGLSEPADAEQRAAASVMAAARRGEILDVIHPDRTREVLVEMVRLADGARRFDRGR